MSGKLLAEAAYANHPNNRNTELRKARDQHARLWQYRYHIRARAPQGTIHAVEWDAPLMPPQEYLKVVHTEEMQSTIVVDYDMWIADRHAAHDEWRDRLLLEGRIRHREEFNPEDPSREVLLAIGPKPQAIEPIIMARDGDRWVLGLPTNGKPTPKPPWAELFFQPPPKREDRLIADMNARLEAATRPATKKAG